MLVSAGTELSGSAVSGVWHRGIEVVVIFTDRYSHHATVCVVPPVGDGSRTIIVPVRPVEVFVVSDWCPSCVAISHSTTSMDP